MNLNEAFISKWDNQSSFTINRMYTENKRPKKFLIIYFRPSMICQRKVITK